MSEEKPSGKIYLSDSEREEIRKHGCKHVGTVNPDNFPCHNCEQSALDCTCSNCEVFCTDCLTFLRLNCRLVRLAYDEKQSGPTQGANQGAIGEKKRRFKLFQCVREL